MSNVLIGIIGVILFIGLALAGALILGSDFLSASNDSQASRVVAQLKQMSDAVSMRNLKLGTTATIADTASLSPRFLKVLPENPTQPGTTDTNLQMRFKDVVTDGVGAGTSPANFAMVRLHPATTRIIGICQAIVDQTGGGATIPTAVYGVSGCMTANGAYFAYSRIN
jgi:hypothetical protein